MGLKLKAAEVFDVIPEGAILEAEVISAKEQDSFFWIDKNDESKGKQREVSFRFVITDDAEYAVEKEDERGNVAQELVSFTNRQLFGRTPTTFSNHPDCKLRVWVQEILQLDDIPVDFELDQEEDGSIPALEGMPVKVAVSHYQKKNADGSYSPKEQVSDVMRIGGFADASEVF
jgi:hypothetical protein